MSRQHDPERDKIIASRYRAGESAGELARALGLSNRAIYLALDRAGIGAKRALHSLTAEQEREVIARYKRGESVFQISKDYDVHRQTIHNLFKRHSIETRPELVRDRVTPEMRAQMIEACLSGNTTDAVAAQFGVSSKTVARALRNENVSLPIGRPKRLTDA